MKIRSAYFLMPLLALAGASCASDSHEPESPVAVKSAWVAIDLTEGSDTRALDMIDDPTDPSTTIRSVTVYLTDNNDVIKAVGEGNLNTKEFVAGSNQTRMHILAAIDAHSPLVEGDTYRIRVVANASMMNPLSQASVEGTTVAHKNVKWTYSPTSYAALSRKGLPQDGVPMSTLGDDYSTVKIEAGKGTVGSPYVAGKDVALTRMMSAIDYNPGFEANEYAIDKEGVLAVGKQNLEVKFLTMQPVNVAKESYLMQRVSQTVTGLVQVPSQSAWYGALPSVAYTAPAAALKEVSATAYEMHVGRQEVKRICYVTENVPDKNAVNVGNATGIIFTAQLRKTSSTPASIAEYFDVTAESHPDLVYFDDGTYQSGLSVYDESKHDDGNWHLVKWETLTVGESTVSGYMVRYLKTIRHGGINPDTIDPNGTTPTAAASDGQCSDMEYATVRSFRYVMRITDVTALPHPYIPSAKPEDVSGDIDVLVEVPDSWTYHRRIEDLKKP